jgi:Cu(I)/Ag(I) efflux system membrane fusion protein
MTTETPTLPPQPRSSSRRSGAALAAVAFVSAALGVGGGYVFHRHHDAATAAAPEPEHAKEQWQCPMHPTIVQDHPGDCPICGMKLVKIVGTPAGGAVERKVAFYRNPMDPKITSQEPRKDEMGMDYLPVYQDELNGEAAPAPEGLSAVNIDPARQQLIGLRTTAAERGEVGGSWRTTGRVTVDETRVHHVNLKVGGYVGHTHAGFVGQEVKRGEPLFTLYSPELLAAQEEYILALRTRAKLRASGAASSDGQDLVDAARRKLELWDIPEPELERMARTGAPTKELTFYAPAPGVITKRDALPGMRVNAGDMPIELTDLSRVWVRADVYESELRHVKMGMPATLTLKAYPNRTFKGRVAFIDPLLDPKTRTVTVRLEFPNPTGELKPEMFGEVVLRGATREGLHVPTDAVVDSGTQNVVFVAVGDGKFQPRAVELGDSDGKNVEVVSGLTEGERVVTRANFLVDSESRLRASLAAMSSAQSTPTGAADGRGSGSTPAPEESSHGSAAHEGH